MTSRREPSAPAAFDDGDLWFTLQQGKTEFKQKVDEHGKGRVETLTFTASAGANFVLEVGSFSRPARFWIRIYRE